MELNAMTEYLQTKYTTASNNLSANTASKSVSGISQNSSREDVEEAVKGFETYFAEQVIKEFKESLKSINDEEDSTISMYKDYFMDSTISTLASQLVDQLGGNITDDFVDQIMRNYGIEDGAEVTEAEVAE